MHRQLGERAPWASGLAGVSRSALAAAQQIAAGEPAQKFVEDVARGVQRQRRSARMPSSPTSRAGWPGGRQNHHIPRARSRCLRRVAVGLSANQPTPRAEKTSAVKGAPVKNSAWRLRRNWPTAPGFL